MEVPDGSDAVVDDAAVLLGAIMLLASTVAGVEA